MDYEKAYKEALELARSYYDENTNQFLDTIFPELRESEDERVIRTLFFLCKDHDWLNGATKEECLNWLEKQQEIPMPNSTTLLKMWEEVEAMLTEKKHENEREWGTWRIAYNAFLEGFGKGFMVKRDYFEKQKEQKELSLMDGNADLYFDEWNQQKQNPTKRQCFEEGLKYAQRLQKEQNREDEEHDFVIYHPLKNGNGKYECIPYSFYGSLSAFSEDKALIDFLRTCFYTKEECEEWIKQKEQKPDIELIQRSWYMEGYHDREFGMEPRWIIKTGEGGPKHELNPKYRQPLTEQQVTEEQLHDLNEAIKGLRMDGCERIADSLHSLYDILTKAQKPAWSEEDEDKIRQIERIAQQAGCTQKLQEEIHDWLNSLRPQPKVELSEDVKKTLDEVSHILVGLNYKQIAKDYKQAVEKLIYARPSWKPSEEHLSALLAVFNDPDNIGSQTCQLALTDLYEQLKKL